MVKISIHAPRAGCDAGEGTTTSLLRIFQSTHPVRGATFPRLRAESRWTNFNPRTPCGVRHKEITLPAGHTWISIHAPRAGCDDEILSLAEAANISIHAPRAGCDAVSGHGVPDAGDFNPRTPCGVRQRSHGTAVWCPDFNPRTPCGVRRGKRWSGHIFYDFNPRTPCGVRRVIQKAIEDGIEFQSTHPVRGATGAALLAQAEAAISIHAPRAGCDISLPSGSAPPSNFNPRTPCGVRQRMLSKTV